MLYCVQQVSHIQFSIHAPSPQSCQDTHCHPRHTPEAKDRHPAPRITCTWLRPHGENGSCLLNPIKFAGVVVFVVFCVCMPSRTQLPQRVPSPACHLQATPRRIPFLAPAACSSLLDLCYSFATAPPCTCHQPSLASPQGQHLSHHSPRHTPKVHLQSSTFYPTSSFRHLGLQSLPTLPPHFRIDFRFLCYAGIASPLLLLLYCRWCPPLAFGELRFALHSCAPPTFHCILAILAQLPYCTTASHPLLATLALHFPSAILATLSHATGCQTDPTSFTAACTPATCLASHAHFHRLLTFLTQALPLLRHTASALPLSALLQL